MNHEVFKKIASKYGQTTVGAVSKEIEINPVLPLDSWYPKFRDIHHRIIKEVGDFDYGKCRTDQPELYRQIRDAEAIIDRMDEVRLSEVVSAIAVWREFVLKAARCAALGQEITEAVAWARMELARCRA